MEISPTSRRIMRNTAMLYFRMAVLMIIGLFTSRVVLRELGVDDFGIYNAVGGVVAMFSVLSTSLSASISRFITFYLGADDRYKPRTVFSTSVSILLIISAIILVLSEILGVWFLNVKMVIPPDRMDAARWVLQFSIVTFIIQLISVPYNASIIAHEQMSAFAWIGIFEAVSKLGIAYALSIATHDKLILYAILYAAVAMAVRIMYGTYCRRHFEECHYTRILDKPLFREMFSFAGWSIIGSTSGILRDHGGNLLLNLFFCPAVNAARGLAVQVNGAVMRFITGFITAINPQITKSYASGDNKYMMLLVFRGSRIATLLTMLVSFPVIFNTGYFLRLWLVEVPPYTEIFVQLVLILTLIEAFSHTLSTAVNATGNIKWYQLIIGGIQLLNLPIDYILLRMGNSPVCVYTVAIALAIACLAARIIILNRQIGLNIIQYLTDVILRVTLIGIVSAILPYRMHMTMPETLPYVLAICAVSLICSSACIYIAGLTSGERTYLREKIGFLFKQ